MAPRQEHDEKSVLEKHGGRKHKTGNIRLTLVVPQAKDLTNIGQHIKGVQKELEKKKCSRADTKASCTGFLGVVPSNTGIFLRGLKLCTGFLGVVPSNTGIFLRGLKLCGESRN